MAAQAFSKFARGKDLQPSQVKYEAWRSDTCVQKVQCIAEYQPGLWKDWFGSHNDVFLNPQFVPLKKLPGAADPPEEFVNPGLMDAIPSGLFVAFQPRSAFAPTDSSLSRPIQEAKQRHKKDAGDPAVKAHAQLIIDDLIKEDKQWHQAAGR